MASNFATKPIYVDPQAEADLISLQRQQALLDALRQRSLQGTDTSGWDQMRQVPKLSPLSGVAQVLGALIAKRRQQNLDEKYRDVMTQQYGRLIQAFGGRPSAQVPQPVAGVQSDSAAPNDPGTVSGSPRAGAIPNDSSAIDPTADSDLQRMAGQAASTQSSTPPAAAITPSARPVPPGATPSGGGSPMNPFGLPPDVAARLYMQNGDAYTKQLLESLGPTRDIRTLQQAGLSPEQIRTAISGKAQKEAYIPPNVVNGVPLDPMTHMPVAAVPNQETGLVQILTPQGWTTMKSADYDRLRAQTAGSVEAAQQANRVIPVEQASGGTRPMWAGAAAGPSPASATSLPASPIQPDTPYTRSPPPGHTQRPASSATQSAGGTPPTDDPFSDVPRISRPAGIGQTTDQAKYLAGIGEARNAKAQELAEQAKSANMATANIDNALGSLDKTNPGPVFQEVNELKGLLVQAGVPESAFQYKPSEGQKLNKELINYALNSIQTSGIFKGSRITQQEVQLMKNEANPSTEMTRKAIRQLLLEARANQQYALHRNATFSQFNAMDGDPNRFEDWYSSHFPRTGFQPTPSPVTALRKSIGGKNYVNPSGRPGDWHEVLQ